VAAQSCANQAGTLKSAVKNVILGKSDLYQEERCLPESKHNFSTVRPWRDFFGRGMNNVDGAGLKVLWIIAI
jgi:hypothetical protein